MVFLKLRKKELLAKLGKFTKNFHSKRQPRTILSEDSCHFAQLCKQFFLSQLEKNHVTQLPTAKKTRAHIEEHTQQWQCKAAAGHHQY